MTSRSGTTRPHSQRQAEGSVRVDMYVPPEHVDELDAITAEHGSRTLALIRAIVREAKAMRTKAKGARLGACATRPPKRTG